MATCRYERKVLKPNGFAILRSGWGAATGDDLEPLPQHIRPPQLTCSGPGQTAPVTPLPPPRACASTVRPSANPGPVHHDTRLIWIVASIRKD